MQMRGIPVVDAVIRPLLKTAGYFIFLTNWDGEIPNCFWKLVAK